MVETGNDGGPLRRPVIALEGRVQAVRETQLEHGAVLADQTRRLEGLDERLESVDAKVDNVDLHVEELDFKVERILEIIEPAGG
jgi:hypothetical protein